MDLKQLKYAIKETIKQKGVMWFVWRILMVLSVLWVLWPDAEELSQPVQKVKQQPDSPEKIAQQSWRKAPEVQRDLRQIMTTAQSTYYWDSFNWMMEYGDAYVPKSFESKTLNMLFAAEALTQQVKPTQQPDEKNPGKMKKLDVKVPCRIFREKIVIQAQANTRDGVACKRGPSDWCKQLKGEKMHCRTGPSGGDGLLDFDMQQFNIKLDRGLSNIPSF